MKHTLVLTGFFMLLVNISTTEGLQEIGTCECGIFLTQNLTELRRMATTENITDSNGSRNLTKYLPISQLFFRRAILVQKVNYNLCDVVGQRICTELCSSLKMVTNALNNNGLCEKIGNGYSILLNIHSRICEGKWYRTGSRALPEPLCCADRKSLPCA